DRVARRLEPRGLAVIGVDTSGDDWARAVEFLRTNSIAYPSVFDADADVASAFRVQTLPTLVVLDRTGVIRAVRSRAVSEAELDGLLAPLLDEPPPG
ncbi:MAG: TlpA family protein disulfide reductase, partial [Deltaproteobacteria bacterium]|nr:TlpA family protein disulfide reductase [Deltaproteobacteria bacterium]